MIYKEFLKIYDKFFPHVIILKFAAVPQKIAKNQMVSIILWVSLTRWCLKKEG